MTAPVLVVHQGLPRPRPSVIYQALPDCGILYCAEQELYFGLNRVGACVWEHLAPACATLDDLARAVAAQFANTSVERVRDDAAQLIQQLHGRALLISAPTA
jgi:hypothetical protein